MQGQTYPLSEKFLWVVRETMIEWSESGEIKDPSIKAYLQANIYLHG